MSVDKALSVSEKFFFEHAGYGRNPDETEAQARTRGAVELAAAEAMARDEGVSFQWSVDADVTSADWIEAGQDGSRDHNPWETWMCVARDEDGKHIGSLGGVDFGRGGSPWGDPYRRVVEAELALEHFCDEVKVARESSESQQVEKRFCATWSELGYKDHQPRNVGAGFFSTGNGYTAEDMQKISGLRVGETCVLDDGHHQVTRLPDVESHQTIGVEVGGEEEQEEQSRGVAR